MEQKPTHSTALLVKHLTATVTIKAILDSESQNIPLAYIFTFAFNKTSYGLKPRQNETKLLGAKAKQTTQLVKSRYQLY